MSASQMLSSCATLEDGRTHIEQNASEVEDEEALLMKELEETNLMFWFHTLSIVSLFPLFVGILSSRILMQRSRVK